MGASVPPDSRSQRASGSFYGNENPPKLVTQAEGRRTMPGGPLLPRLPRNPFATSAHRIGKALNSPAKWPPEGTP
jgi:hypothetical protein